MIQGLVITQTGETNVLFHVSCLLLAVCSYGLISPKVNYSRVCAFGVISCLICEPSYHAS